MMDTVVLDLANPEQALGLYLDALLRETPPTPTEVSSAQALVPASVPVATRVVVPVEAVTTEAVAVPVRARDLELFFDPTPASAPAPSRTAAPIPTEPFQALLFQVAGLTVAVSLVDLNGILRYPPQLVAVLGLPRWSLGVVRHRDTNVVAVDSITLFVPERLREAARAHANPRYLVLFGGGRFGLACDAVDRVIRLTPAEVRWRGERGRRPWLAGTVREHLCALLEIPALARLLSAGYLEEPDN
jgi:purine-binding chemotaxis protein CheW